jgi:hypothetical protein
MGSVVDAARPGVPMSCSTTARPCFTAKPHCVRSSQAQTSHGICGDGAGDVVLRFVCPDWSRGGGDGQPAARPCTLPKKSTVLA